VRCVLCIHPSALCDILCSQTVLYTSNLSNNNLTISLFSVYHHTNNRSISLHWLTRHRLKLNSASYTRCSTWDSSLSIEEPMIIMIIMIIKSVQIQVFRYLHKSEKRNYLYKYFLRHIGIEKVILHSFLVNKLDERQMRNKIRGIGWNIRSINIILHLNMLHSQWRYSRTNL